MKKYASQWSVLGACCVIASISAARAPTPQPFSLLVVPEQVNPVQVGVDLAHRRPVALVTYRVSARTGELVLHGWGNNDWVPISLNDYRDGQFLVRQPERIILVEGLDDLPMDLVLASGWGPRVMSVAATNPADFINAMGQLFEFSSAEWRWFANRYRLGIEQLQDDRASVSWYDQMSAARGQPPRRHVEEPPPVPVAPLPVPILDVEERQDPRQEAEPVVSPVIERPRRVEEVRRESAPVREQEERAPEPRRVPEVEPPASGPVAPLPAISDLEWPDAAVELDEELRFVK